MVPFLRAGHILLLAPTVHVHVHVYFNLSLYYRVPMFDNLALSVTAPLFQQWEVSDQRQKLTYDLATAESQPNTGMAANSAHVHVF